MVIESRGNTQTWVQRLRLLHDIWPPQRCAQLLQRGEAGHAQQLPLHLAGAAHPSVSDMLRGPGLAVINRAGWTRNRCSCAAFNQNTPIR